MSHLRLTAMQCYMPLRWKKKNNSQSGEPAPLEGADGPPAKIEESCAVARPAIAGESEPAARSRSIRAEAHFGTLGWTLGSGSVNVLHVTWRTQLPTSSKKRRFVAHLSTSPWPGAPGPSGLKLILAPAAAAVRICRGLDSRSYQTVHDGVSISSRAKTRSGTLGCRILKLLQWLHLLVKAHPLKYTSSDSKTQALTPSTCVAANVPDGAWNFGFPLWFRQSATARSFAATVFTE